MTKPKSGRFHWMKWWPSRWYSETGLRACSLAARGAWADIVNAIHLQDSGGVFLIGGEVPDSADVARLLGCTEREWKAAEAELERRKVFSRRESDGAIYCRSMVREAETVGVPQGSPVGDPTDTPQGTLGLPEGSPPSRALSSSILYPLPEGEGERGRDEPPEPPPKPKRAEPTGPQAECAAHWRSEWTRCRDGTKCAPLRREDFVLIAEFLTFAEPENVRRRMTAMLEDPEEFVRKKASIRLLRSQWDNYATVAAKGSKPRHVETVEERDVRERWMSIQGRLVRDKKILGIPPYPGHSAALASLERTVSA